MPNRASPVNLIMSLIAFVVFMGLVLGVVGGFGVGMVEFVIWVALLAIGVGLIAGRYRAASSGSG